MRSAIPLVTSRQLANRRRCRKEPRDRLGFFVKTRIAGDLCKSYIQGSLGKEENPSTSYISAGHRESAPSPRPHPCPADQRTHVFSQHQSLRTRTRRYETRWRRWRRPREYEIQSLYCGIASTDLGANC